MQKVRGFKEREKDLKCCFQARSGFSSSEIFLVVSKQKMERKIQILERKGSQRTWVSDDLSDNKNPTTLIIHGLFLWRATVKKNPLSTSNSTIVKAKSFI